VTSWEVNNNMEMDPKIMKIQRDLQEQYLKSFESVKGQKVYDFYETMVKLNAEMTAIALQRYHEEFNNED